MRYDKKMSRIAFLFLLIFMATFLWQPSSFAISWGDHVRYTGTGGFIRSTPYNDGPIVDWLDGGETGIVVDGPFDGITYRWWKINWDDSSLETGWSAQVKSDTFVVIADTVTLTLYVHDGSDSGPLLSGASVTGFDGGSQSFNKTTGAGGYVTIAGTPGTWQFTASATGYNVNSWNQSITITQERHAFLTPNVGTPTVSIMSPSGNTSVSNATTSYTFSGSATAPGSAIAAVEWRVNGGNWNTASGTTSWNFAASLTVGNNQIDVRSRNTQGTYSTTESRTITREAAVGTPTVSIMSPSGNTSVSNATTSYTFSGSATAPGSAIAAVEWRVNGGNWNTASGTTSWNFAVSLTVGNNQVDVRSRNTQGTYSTTESRIITREAQVSIPIIQVTGNLNYGEVVIGESRALQMRISNTGQSSLLVKSIQFPSGFSSTFSGISLPAGEHRDITIVFAPSVLGHYNGTIIVNSNSSGGNSTLEVSGTCISTGLTTEFVFPVGYPDGSGWNDGSDCIAASWTDSHCEDGLAFLEPYDYGGETGRIFHPGEDWNFPDDCNKEIHAIADGTIISQPEGCSWGTMVIRHDNVPGYGTIYSVYGHICDGNSLAPNGYVERGQVIGKIGGKGKNGCDSFNCHLHFEIRRTEMCACCFPWESRGQGTVDYVMANYIHPSRFLQERRAATGGGAEPFAVSLESSSLQYSVGDEAIIALKISGGQSPYRITLWFPSGEVVESDSEISQISIYHTIGAPIVAGANIIAAIAEDTVGQLTSINTIEVDISGALSLTAEPPSLSAPALGGSTMAVNVTTTASWYAFSDSEWATVIDGSGTGTSSFTVNCLENNTGTARTANITVVGTGTTPHSVQVSVTQSIPEGEGEVHAEGEGEPAVEGEAPVEGEGEVPAEGEGEPPVEGEGEIPAEGEGEPPVEGEGEPPVEGEGEMPVEGEGEAPAEGEGEISAEGEGEIPPVLSVTPVSRKIESRGGTVTFTIQTTAAWTAISDATWATLNTSYGTGKSTLTVHCLGNRGLDRTATITIIGISTTPTSVTVKVNQSGQAIEGEDIEGEAPVEGEGEGKDDTCGCCAPSSKSLDTLLGDWLLVALALMALAVVSSRIKV